MRTGTAGFLIKVYAIAGGRVSYYVKDPRINQHIPTIPSEVHSVNFTWRSGTRKYYYNFDRLQSLDETILKPPTVSIKVQGKVPEESRRKCRPAAKPCDLHLTFFLAFGIPSFYPEFNVALPCAANASGTAMFSIGLLITRRGKPVPGTPIRLSLKKECAPRGVYDTTSLRPLQGSVYASFMYISMFYVLSCVWRCVRLCIFVCCFLSLIPPPTALLCLLSPLSRQHRTHCFAYMPFFQFTSIPCASSYGPDRVRERVWHG